MMVDSLKELKYILFHPVDGFDQMKEKKTGSFKLATLISFLWFLTATFERQFTHFRFNGFDTENTNVLYIFISTVVMFVFFCVGNWSLCTLLDGEGSIHEIWIVTGYAILPFVLSMFISAVLSNIMTVSEAPFMGFITTAGIIWTGLLLLFGMMQIHRYDFKKTLFSIIGSFIALTLILFISFLIILLFQQIYAFLDSIYKEVFYRIEATSSEVFYRIEATSSEVFYRIEATSSEVFYRLESTSSEVFYRLEEISSAIKSI